MVKEFLIAHPLAKILGKNMWSCREKIPLAKNLKIFYLAQKLREKEYFKVINSDPYREKRQQKRHRWANIR